MLRAESYPICVVESRAAERDLDDVMDDHEKDRLVDWLALNPEVGDVIPNTNGVRKMRWRLNGKGKRGGLRIIYYFRDLNMPVYLLGVYKKGEKLSLTMKEKREIRKLVEELVSEYASRHYGSGRAGLALA